MLNRSTTTNNNSNNNKNSNNNTNNPLRLALPVLAARLPAYLFGEEAEHNRGEIETAPALLQA